MYLPFEPGKLTEEVKTHLPDATRLILRRKAEKMGMTLSAYFRDLCCIDAHGAPHDELMMTHRRNVRAAAQGQLVAQERANAWPDEAPASSASSDIQC